MDNINEWEKPMNKICQEMRNYRDTYFCRKCNAKGGWCSHMLKSRTAKFKERIKSVDRLILP